MLQYLIIYIMNQKQSGTLTLSPKEEIKATTSEVSETTDTSALS